MFVTLYSLAALIPVPEESPARAWRNGAAMALAIVIGLRISRWLERL